MHDDTAGRRQRDNKNDDTCRHAFKKKAIYGLVEIS